jgi:hypothetical protein
MIKKIQIAVVTVALAAIGAATAFAADTDYLAPVAAVSDTIKNNVSVFRATEAVTVPDDVRTIVNSDMKDGKTFLGQNVELARPAAYKSGGKTKTAWIVPAETDNLFAYLLAGKNTTGIGGQVDADFLKYGLVSWDPEGSRKNVALLAMFPDGVKSMRVKSRTKKKNGKYKYKTRTFKAQNNVIIVTVKNAYSVSVAGQTAVLFPKKKK